MDLKELPYSAVHSLRAADGYLDLGMLPQARRELERVPAEYRETLACLALRLRLVLAERDWAEGMRLAAALCERDGKDPGWFVSLAYASRRAVSIDKAREVLLSVRERFPDVAVIPYNLACYECQLGAADKAREYLREAFRIDAAMREAALRDEDLAPLHGELRKAGV